MTMIIMMTMMTMKAAPRNGRDYRRRTGHRGPHHRNYFSKHREQKAVQRGTVPLQAKVYQWRKEQQGNQFSLRLSPTVNPVQEAPERSFRCRFNYVPVTRVQFLIFTKFYFPECSSVLTCFHKASRVSGI